MTPKVPETQTTLPIDLGAVREEVKEEKFGTEKVITDGSGQIQLRDTSGRFDGKRDDYATYDD